MAQDNPFRSLKGRASFSVGPIQVNMGNEDTEEQNRPATLEDLRKLREETHNMILDLENRLRPKRPKK